MARVLSSKDVAEGHVPNSSSFAHVLEQVRVRIYSTAGVRSSIAIGSVHRGDSNCLSDLDIVVAYYRETRGSLLVVLAELFRDAKEQAVKVEFIPLVLEFAALGAHTWTPSFTSHVRWAEMNGGLLFGPAITELVKPITPGLSEGLDYAVGKLSSISKRSTTILTMEESALDELLSEIIQVPMFLVRKVLWDRSQMAPDSKANVVDNYRRIASPREIDLFNILVSIASGYRALVESKPKRQFYVSRRKELLQNQGLYVLLSFLEETIAGYHHGG